MLALLADEKSKEIWKAVVRYRTRRIPIKASCYSEGDQYFVEEIIRPETGEVFIDGGGYTGDTVQQFLDTARKHKASYRRIIVFEPDIENYKLIKKFFGRQKKIILIKKGLSDCIKKIGFTGDGAVGRISQEDKDSRQISVINIDAVPECSDATWIKMDIEGAEMDALRGARNVILKNRPKLTISIYHSDEDMIRIAEYIHELVPEYKLYVRHHSKGHCETVLYAVI